MNKDKELEIELIKNKAEEAIINEELNVEIERFIINLNNGLGEEIKNNNVMIYNQPIKYKKPYKLKWKSFLNNLKKVLGI